MSIVLHWCFRFDLLDEYTSSKLNRMAIIWYAVTYVAGNFRYNVTLDFRAFRLKFEAIDGVMSHLTYTRKRYNPGEAPEGLDGVDACERECHGMLHSLPVHLLDSFVHLPSSLPRAVLALWTLFSFRIITFWISRLNAKHAVYRMVIAVDFWKKDRMNIRRKAHWEPHFPCYPFFFFLFFGLWTETKQTCANSQQSLERFLFLPLT